MKIISWNVNSIKNIIKTNKLYELLINNKCDVLCLNETKLNDANIDYVKNNIDKILLFKYHYYNNSTIKKGYSGTYICTNKKPFNVLYGINIDNVQHDNEGRVLTLEYEKYYIVNVYVPNAGEQLKRLEWKINVWYNHFITFISILKKRNKKIILCGDFNVAHREIDIKNPNSNINNAGFTIVERKHFTDFLNHFNLIDVYRELYPNKIEYTYWSYRSNSREKNIGWRIDYILSDKILLKYIKDYKILTNFYGSDHAPLLVNINNKILI